MSRPRDHRRKAWHCRTCGVETAFAGFDKCGQCVEDEKLTEAGDSIDRATAAIQRLNEAERLFGVEAVQAVLTTKRPDGAELH